MAPVSRDGLPTSQSSLVRVMRHDWIEVVAKDRFDDEPLAGWRVKLELPDGEVVEATLDDAGTYRHEQMLPGACIVTLEPPEPSGATS